MCKLRHILNWSYWKEQHRKGYESICWAQWKDEFIKANTNHFLNVTFLIVLNVNKVGIVHMLCFACNIMFVLSPGVFEQLTKCSISMDEFLLVSYFCMLYTNKI